MYAERYAVALTTDGDGDATGYTPVVTGRVVNVVYVKDDFADGVDFAITSETLGLNIWTEENVNASKTVAPRQPTDEPDGTDHLYLSTDTAVVHGDIVLASERVKIVVSSGGATTSGTFHVIVA